jgi:teichuronic acid biosynthesis glycosyltransferase TuaC
MVMRVLIVCSGNYPDPEKNFSKSRAFVYDQMLALELYHKVEFDKFLIRGKGVFGYFSNLKSLRNKIRNGDFDLVHAHYSLSGVLAFLASNKPVITTFHGSDINIIFVHFISLLASFFSYASIFVSRKLLKKSFYKPKKAYIIPCGVDIKLFSPMKRVSARDKLKLSTDKKYILFSSAFNNPVKNYNLTARALAILNDPDIEIMELRGFEREEVNILFSAVDLALLTSFTEGSSSICQRGHGMQLSDSIYRCW